MFIIFFQVFTELLNKADIKDKTLALKAIKNSGLSDAVPILKAFLEDKEIKKNMPYIRVIAIQAHIRLHIHSPRRVEVSCFINIVILACTKILP